jgi:hypothetical protein
MSRWLRGEKACGYGVPVFWTRLFFSCAMFAHRGIDRDRIKEQPLVATKRYEEG